MLRWKRSGPHGRSLSFDRATQVKDLPPDVQVVGTRWVHTDKNEQPRLMAEALAKRTGKTKEQIRREFPFEAKSRLVVQGDQENGNTIDSPTASLLSFNIVCVLAVLRGWMIWACDASTAYLQSQGISRLLILRPPRPLPPPPPGISPSDLPGGGLWHERCWPRAGRSSSKP